ncbi:MAG: class I SAM-dependent methyltransferase [Thermoplasmatota archaeon]
MRFNRAGWLLDRLPYRHGSAMADALGSAPGFVLDLGGGTGRVAARIARPGLIVCDLERSLLERARMKGFPTVQCDVQHLPFRTNSVVGVFAVDAFHHFREQRAVLDEIERILRPTGRAVIEEIDPSSVTGFLLRIVEWLARFGSTFRTVSSMTTLFREASLHMEIVRWNRRDYAAIHEKASATP